jgi:hypothetical protein
VTRSTTVPLDNNRLYLLDTDCDLGLQLLPVVRLGDAPTGESTACYFYSKRERGESCYVSYHYEGEPELREDESFANSIVDSLTR